MIQPEVILNETMVKKQNSKSSFGCELIEVRWPQSTANYESRNLGPDHKVPDKFSEENA